MSVWSDWSERVRSLVFRRRDERELDEELRFHVDMEAAARTRGGLDPAEARRRSAAAFGGVERIKEDVRDARGVRGATDFGGDVRYALRTLRSRPGFTLVAVATIALGIAATTAVFSTFDTVILRPLPYQNPGQLVRLYQHSDDDPAGRNVVTPVHFLVYQQRVSSLQSLAALNLYDRTGADIGQGNDVRRIRTEIVSAGYFDVLHTPPMLGRPFTPDEDIGTNSDQAPGSPVVILSNSLWRSRFRGDPGVIGRALVMSGVPHTIVGVMPAGFADPLTGRDVDAWVPLDLTPGNDISNADNHYLSVIGRLGPGVSLARAQAELDAVSIDFGKLFSNGEQHMRARLYPLKDDIVGGTRGSLALIVGAVGLVLLLVCVNVANLLLVRSSERSREFAMRTALGARRGRLVRQLLTESLVLAAAGAVLALPAARGLMAAIVALGAGSVPRLDHLGLSVPLLAFTVMVTALSAVLFGLAPAWRAGRTEPAEVLRRHGRTATGDRRQGRLRATLVVVQIGLAFVLLSGAGLLVASFRALQSLPLGITPQHVFTFQVHLPSVRYDSLARSTFHRRFDAAITAIPGVRAAGATSKLPATGSYNSWGVRALTGPLVGTQQAQSEAEQRIVTPGYFAAAGVHLVAGRTFDDGDTPLAADRVVISENFAKRLFPGVSPLGQRLRSGDHTSQVIGVVADGALDPLGTPAFYVYHSHDQFSGDRNWALFEAVSTSLPSGVAATAIRRALAAIDPQLVMDQAMPLEDAVGQGTSQRAFTLKVLLAFAATALLLAALGVFGVLSYGVRLRSQEFGVRLALGATPERLLRSVLAQALAMAAAGVALGLAGAVPLSRLMATMVFHLSPLDPVVLATVAAMLVLIGTTAGYLPARRAMRTEVRRVLE